jgi:Gas vesicle synthesis protein GvpO
MSEEPEQRQDPERRQRRERPANGSGTPSGGGERQKRRTRHDPEEKRSRNGGLDARGAVRKAVEELNPLIVHTIEGVVGVRRDDETWVATVSVIEDAHVPSSSDILSEYEVRLDADGELLGYSRRRRYVRGRTDT